VSVSYLETYPFAALDFATFETTSPIQPLCV